MKFIAYWWNWAGVYFLLVGLAYGLAWLLGTTFERVVVSAVLGSAAAYVIKKISEEEPHGQ